MATKEDDSADSKRPSHVTLEKVLEMAKLTQFQEDFTKAGYAPESDGFKLLYELTDEDFKSTLATVGLKPGHRARLRRTKQLLEDSYLQLKASVSKKKRGGPSLNSGDSYSWESLLEGPELPPTTTEKLDPLLVAGLDSSNLERVVLESLSKIRKLLSKETNPPIQQAINSGILPRVVELLENKNTTMAFEAAWVVTNIVSGTSAHVLKMIKAGAVPKLKQLLKHENLDVREQAVWAIGNIAGDRPECRDYVLSQGVLAPILKELSPSSKIGMLRNATWALSNLCRGKPQPKFNQIQPAIPVLARILYIKDTEVLTDACWCLSYISDDTGPSNQKIQAVLNTGVARRLIELLKIEQQGGPALSNSVLVPALRSIGNIVTGDDMQTQVMLNAGVLEALRSVLQSWVAPRGIQKEAFWTISNITAGNSSQIQSVIDAGLIPTAIQAMNTSELQVAKEAAWAICNAAMGGSSQQKRYIAEQGGLRAMFNGLSRWTDDAKGLRVCLEGIENMFKTPSDQQGRRLQDDIPQDTRTRIQALQNHPDSSVQASARKIVEDFL